LLTGMGYVRSNIMRADQRGKGVSKKGTTQWLFAKLLCEREKSRGRKRQISTAQRITVRTTTMTRAGEKIMRRAVVTRNERAWGDRQEGKKLIVEGIEKEPEGVLLFECKGIKRIH